MRLLNWVIIGSGRDRRNRFRDGGVDHRPETNFARSARRSRGSGMQKQFPSSDELARRCTLEVVTKAVGEMHDSKVNAAAIAAR